MPATTPIDIAPSRTYFAGQNIYFRVAAPVANTDAARIDRVTAQITSATGDRETITVFETGENTGVFLGSIPTVRFGGSFVAGDCQLSVDNGTAVNIAISSGTNTLIATTMVDILADPFGVVFDSEDGTPVSGATVTLIDVRTGLPATVFAEDGVTPWPSTVISGQPIIDAAGRVYQMPPGEYWFPLAPLGTYRLEITPPSPYTAPSVVSPQDLGRLTRPDGTPFLILDASYGGEFELNSPIPVQVDIPLDRPSVAVTIIKQVSQPQAAPGDVVIYTVTVRNQDQTRAKRDVVLVDTPSPWLRLRRDTVRIDGEADANAVTISPDGSRLTIALDSIAAGMSRRITYAMSIRANAPAGVAENVVEATDSRGVSAQASARLTVERDNIGSRMTIIGRITEGTCDIEADRRGIPGVRVMLEDGSFALTDRDGRYHFEGIVPGTHVVQAQRQTLPEGGEFVDCTRSTRSAGSPISRFVIGQGGSLVVADFHATLPADWQPPVEDEESELLGGAEAAGAETDWFALGNGPAEFLFPEVGHNPRAPAVRVVIRHGIDETVALTANGEAVDGLAYDGKTKSPDGTYAISIWRGIPLDRENVTLAAAVKDSDGLVVTELTRDVSFAAAPVRAELIAEQSALIADGASLPVIAVRITDRNGLPVRDGVSGSVGINSPYESAALRQRLQLQQLTGLGGSAPNWTVQGDDGIALIELAPTMVSGPLRLDFNFTDGDLTRTQEIDTWIIPGDQEWTLVGLAEGTIGSRSIADAMNRSGDFDSDLGDDARVAFYAKGKIAGGVLLTASYDSAKSREEERLLGFIDPNAYYTVFADGTNRQFDAASRDKFYIRIETRQFYALYGDFLTGFDQTQLARYERAATGFKAEGRFGNVGVQGFAAEIETRFRRDEIQGAGISGPYRLSSRAIVPNSEQVTIEVRDRFRSELIVESRQLLRFIDYDIDLLSGNITFKEPVLSRDFDLNPQFIVITYEIDTLSGTGQWNAGIRGDITLADGAVRVGSSFITDKGDSDRTNIAAVDARVRLGTATEIRAEAAVSNRAGEASNAFLLEADHRTGNVDVVAYARRIESEFGTGQQNLAERGRFKIGADARYRFDDQLSVVGSIWRDNSLTDNARRDAAQIAATYRSGNTDLRAGLSHFDDRLADGTTGSSTTLDAGVTQRLLNNRLELSGTSSIALGSAESIDLPSRYRFGARYSITQDVRVIGAYEIAQSDLIDARTARVGFEFTPWTGGRITTTYGQNDVTEFGQRSFAAFGLSQTLAVTSNLNVDATIDGQRTLSGNDFTQVINLEQPVASGGQIGQDGSLFEDFTALTLGLGWRHERWAMTARGEYRDGEFADRFGLTAGVIRQLGEGSVVGSGFTFTKAEGENGSTTEIIDAAVSFAHRPAEDPFAFLGKVEFRSDRVEGAVAGEVGAAGRTALLVDGDAISQRVIGSLSTNWSPRGFDDNDNDAELQRGLFDRTEIGVFLGGRYSLTGVDGFDLSGFTGVAAIDARVGIGERFEIGGQASVRYNFTEETTDFSFGPQIGFTPTDDVLLTVGYNIAGYRDRDFSAARDTQEGIFAGIRLKFDADSFSFLGLNR